MRSPQDGLFLETTIHAARALGSTAEREAYHSQHAGRELRSSTYVLGEFKKVFLRDAVRFHRLLSDSESVAEALHRLNHQVFRDRTHRRCVQLFAVLAEDNEIGRDPLLERLEMLIEWQLEGRFRHGLQGDLLDSTRCRRAGAALGKAEDGYDTGQLSCTQAASPRCGLRQFINERANDFLAVEAILTNRDSDAELERLLSALRAVLDGANPAGRVCESLADAVIAIECPAELSLQTTNERHYGPLCQALRKALAVWKWPPV